MPQRAVSIHIVPDSDAKGRFRQTSDTMMKIVKARGFEIVPILGEETLKENLVGVVDRVAKDEDAVPIGTVMLIYCGHGDESRLGTKRLQTWLLADGTPFWEDAIWKLLVAPFPRETQVVVVSDSCYSEGLGSEDLARLIAYSRLNKKAIDKTLLASTFSGERVRQWFARAEAILAFRAELNNIKLPAMPRRLLSAGPKIVTACAMTDAILDLLNKDPHQTYRQLESALVSKPGLETIKFQSSDPNDPIKELAAFLPLG